MRDMIAVEEVAVPGEGVNSISILGRDLLLVDVGGGAETHLAASSDQPIARAALVDGRLESSRAEAIVGSAEAALTARRWAPSTIYGRIWWEMAAGEGGTFRPWAGGFPGADVSLEFEFPENSGTLLGVSTLVLTNATWGSVGDIISGILWGAGTSYAGIGKLMQSFGTPGVPASQ